MSALVQATPRVLLAIGLLVLVPPAVETRWAQPLSGSINAAADAKPIFLTTRAAVRGEDPTDPEVVRQLADMHEVYRGGHRIHGRLPPGKGSPYASLYPPPLPVLLARFAPETWWEFAAWWRRTGLLLVLLGGAAGGAAGGRGLGRVPGALAGLAVALWCLPGLELALQLGQANLHLAGLSGLALLGLSLWGGVGTGLLLALGAVVKLAPLALAPVLGLGRRWWGLAALGLGLGLGLAVTAELVAPLDVLHDVQASLAYTGRLNPAWLEGPQGRAPTWVWKLWALRSVHLGLVTAGLAALALGKRARRSPQASAHRGAAGALVLAWLGLVAAPGQLIYGPLLLPPLAWLAGRALAPEGLLVSGLLAGLALAGARAVVLGAAPPSLQGLDAAATLTVLAAGVWWCVAAELLWGLRRELGPGLRWRLPAVGLVATVLVGLWLRS